MKFKIGDKVKIVGSYGGCADKLCKDCECHKNKVLIITSLNSDNGGISGPGNRTVRIENEGSGQWCTVDERDLQFIRIENWRERII